MIIVKNVFFSLMRL